MAVYTGQCGLKHEAFLLSHRREQRSIQVCQLSKSTNTTFCKYSSMSYALLHKPPQVKTCEYYWENILIL